MADRHTGAALTACLEQPRSEEVFLAAQEHLTVNDADSLFDLAVAAISAGPGVSCSVNIVPHCNIPRVLAEKVPLDSGFVLCFYRDRHFVGFKIITRRGVIFDEVVKCGQGVLKTLLGAAVAKVPGLDTKSTDKPQFVGWAMRQLPLPCPDWDLVT